MNWTFRPAILHLADSYDRRSFFSDVGAGLTVGFIALPLAIGFAIASGCTPAQGLWTAIVGGFLITVLGGSKFQIGGPTGAFVPVLAGVVAVHGFAGLALATMLAGLMLILAGLFKLGALLRYIPFPVVAGFTSGIAVIIFLGQVPSLLGLTLAGKQHAPEIFLETLRHLPEVHWPTALTGAAGLLTVLLLPKLTRRIPAAIVAVLVTTALVAFLHWPVETIGSKFGELPSTFPGWHLFVKRMEEVSHVSLLTPDTDPEHDGSLSLRGKEVPEGVVLFRFEGPLFFAVVAKLEHVLRTYTGRPKIIIFRLRHVPSIDASALHALEIAVSKMQHDGVRILLTAVQPQPMRALTASGLTQKLGPHSFCRSIDDALLLANQLLAEAPPNP